MWSKLDTDRVLKNPRTGAFHQLADVKRVGFFVIILAVIAGTGARAQGATGSSAAGVPAPAVGALLDRMAENYYMPSLRAAFGTFTYEYTGLPTPFSRYLEDVLAMGSTSASRVKVLNRNAASALDPVLSKAYGQFILETGAEALLSGKFFAERGQVRVRLELTELSTGTLIGASDLPVPTASVPPSISVAPAPATADRARELARLSGASGGTAGGLVVSVATDRGAGAAYRNGEVLAVIVGVNKDAYVRLYHVNGDGYVQLIWPNRFDGGDGLVRAGSPVRMPPEGSTNYSFVMTPPFGTEFIKAVASTKPFTDNPMDFADLGVVSSGTMTRGLAIQSGQASQVQVAESLASYYIGP